MLNLVVALAAIASMIPAAVAPLRQAGQGSPQPAWPLLAVAAAGPLVYLLVGFRDSPWHAGLSGTLWISVGAGALLFALLAIVLPNLRRLAPILLGYLCLLAIFGLIWTHGPAAGRAGTVDAWLVAHVVLSVLAYALATVAAVAGAAVLLQERALKRKRPGRLTEALPAVADCDRLQVGFLAAAELVLGIDILSGIAVEYVRSGALIRFEHKPLLSILAFLVILALLVMHRRSGVPGRQAGRFVLVAYLLLTLAYPGVKFVTDVLMA